MKKMLLPALGVLIGFTLVAAATYAWFSASVTSKNVKDQVVSTGTLELTYTDGTEIKLEKARPGATATKTITVKNTGTLETSYNLVWQVLKNEITNDEMVMSATCKRLKSDGGVEENCEGLDETPITGNMVLKGVDIPSGYSHEYTVTVTFKELSKDQNYNQGKSFMGVLGVDEYKEVTPTYCTYDGELTQGAEFTDGTYVYRYMQEYSFDNTFTLKWVEMNNDGWGVILAESDSTDSITKAPCTYINEKPILSMNFLFYNSKASNIDTSNFNTSNVINMMGMFNGSKAKSIDVSNLDTSKVTTMYAMFAGSSATEIKGLENFDTSNVDIMQFMFNNSNVTSIDLSNFNTSKVIIMEDMFSNSSVVTIKGLNSFNTKNVTSMRNMFYGCENIKSLDLSSFDIDTEKGVSAMFSESPSLVTIYASEKIKSLQTLDIHMFDGCTSLIGGNGTKYNSLHVDAEYARIDTELTPGYFTLKTN